MISETYTDPFTHRHLGTHLDTCLCKCLQSEGTIVGELTDYQRISPLQYGCDSVLLRDFPLCEITTRCCGVYIAGTDGHCNAVFCWVSNVIPTQSEKSH